VPLLRLFSPFLTSLLCPFNPSNEQLRRQTRERREYIFKKSQESQERAGYERKQRIKDLLAQGKSLPTELREEARKGAKDLVLDEAQAGE
jgi:U3 small nucleolar ribonucleoprotein protein IMP4